MKYRNYFAGMVLLFAGAWISACGEEADKFELNSTDKESDNDTDTETDSDRVAGEPCDEFHAYAEGCEISGQSLMTLDLMCTMMDGLFIESFLREMLDCFSPESCDEFIAMLASDGSTDTDMETDTESAADPFSICTESALYTAEPGPENVAFQEHFCAYALQCLGLAPTDCALYFTDPDGLLLFSVLDAPYITDADACVYPMPTCTEDVAGCLEDVTTDVRNTLSLLSGK